MQSAVGQAFDLLAQTYDDRWTNTPVGQIQRDAVWRSIDPLFQAGDSVLDLGCGTGADALHLMSRGINVRGVDASAEMVALAASRGVPTQQLTLEELGQLKGSYDGALSNFGVINCVVDLKAVSVNLGRLIRRDGYLALCTMGPLCLWEICHYLIRGRSDKALRRFSVAGSTSALGVHVNYPSVLRLRRALKNEFELLSWRGIALSVPPSYISSVSAKSIHTLGTFDRYTAHLPLLRMFADHRLFIFKRL